MSEEAEEERKRRRNPFPSLPDPLSLFPSKSATQTDILVVHALDSPIHRTNLYPVDQQYGNQLCHPLNRGFVNSVTHLSNNWAPGKERCSKAKSPVKGNNLTPRLEYGPLNVMFEVLPRYQSLRLYFCIPLPRPFYHCAKKVFLLTRLSHFSFPLPYKMPATQARNLIFLAPRYM